MDDKMDDCAAHIATVMESGPDRLLLRVRREREEEAVGCRCCPVKNLCRRGDGTFTVAAPPNAGLAPGDQVEVCYGEANPAVASLVMFLPALVGLFVGGFAAWRMTDGDDWTFLAGCVAGLAAGLGITWLIGRRASSLKPRVTVMAKL